MTVQEITSQTHLSLLINSRGYTFIDYYADWCGPCRSIAPKIEELSNRINTIKFYKLNVGTHSFVNNIQSLPTFRIYREGQLLKQIVGANISRIIDAIEEILL